MYKFKTINGRTFLEELDTLKGFDHINYILKGTDNLYYACFHILENYFEVSFKTKKEAQNYLNDKIEFLDKKERVRNYYE